MFEVLLSARRGVLSGIVTGLVACAAGCSDEGSDRDAAPRDPAGSCVLAAESGRGRAATLDRARRTVARHADAIVRGCPGVVGVGVGAAAPSAAPAPGERAHVIVVHLRDEPADRWQAGSLDGVRVRYEVTGEFEAQ